MIRRTVLAVCIAAITGCNFAPPYQRPATSNPAQFKETQAPDANGEWKPAEPRDDQLGGNWWEIFHDSTLNDLESKVADANQNVIAAEANFRASRALVDQAEAGLFPTLSLNPSATRSRSSAAVAQLGGAGSSAGGANGSGTGSTTSPTSGGTTTQLGGGSTKPHTIYTFRSKRRIRSTCGAACVTTLRRTASTREASAAQVGTAILTNQSQLAQNYFELRVTDELRRVLAASLEDFRTSLHLVETLVKNGIQSEEDLAQAQAQLHATEAQATDLGIARAQYEHAIAVLIGVPPAQFLIPYERVPLNLPDIPVGVPSDLLERRPDVATAERQVAASNAQIGIARAAFFPTLTLGANAGYESTSLGKLFDWPNRFWSLGPALAETIFDGGARSAQVNRAWALNDQAVANYRQTVLSAFQSVEDNLASLRILSEEVLQQRAAAEASRRAVELSVVRYRNGVDSYVNVITAQNAFLNSRQAELQVELRRLVASVSLVNNLGGGWSSSPLAKVASGAQPLSDNSVAVRKTTTTAQPEAAPISPPNPPAVVHDFEPDEILKLDDDAMRTPPQRHR